MKYGTLTKQSMTYSNLYQKIHEKLIFTLCKACAETRNQNECKHTDDKRSFIGTWTTNEINKAIEKGYEALRTYEVWHFDKTIDDLFKLISEDS